MRTWRVRNVCPEYMRMSRSIDNGNCSLDEDKSTNADSVLEGGGFWVAKVVRR